MAVFKKNFVHGQQKGPVFLFIADADAQMVRQIIAFERADNDAPAEQGLKAVLGFQRVFRQFEKSEVCSAGPDVAAESRQANRKGMRPCRTVCMVSA